MMLANVISQHQTQLSGLANSWLASGANAFAVCENDLPIMSWPSGKRPSRKSLSAAIKIGGQRLGNLMVTAPDSAVNRIRLEADANMISSLAEMVQELSRKDIMGVGGSDQLDDLYQIIVTADIELKSTLEYVAREIATRIEADSIFVRARLQDGSDYWFEHGQVLDEKQWIDDCIEWLETQELLQHQFVRNIPGSTAKNRNLLLISIPDRGVAKMVLGLVKKGNEGFSNADRRMVKTIAGYAGLQIEYAVLSEAQVVRSKLDLELNLAKQLQTRLLPQKASGVAGLDVCAMTQPASMVGGDFYDFINRQDEPFAFAVCDISGKGLSAAMMVAMTRMVIRSFAGNQANPAPATIVDNANLELYDDFTQANMLATMFIGQYEPLDKVLHYANAGHSPVVYYSVEDGVRLLQAEGPPVGVLATSYSNNQQVKLDPGNILVVGTDGLSEARNEKGEMFGYNRLMDVVADCADCSAQEIAETVREAVGRFSGNGPAEDDQTLVVCKGV